jgi:hypothetical protein
MGGSRGDGRSVHADVAVGNETFGGGGGNPTVDIGAEAATAGKPDEVGDGGEGSAVIVVLGCKEEGGLARGLATPLRPQRRRAYISLVWDMVGGLWDVS